MSILSDHRGVGVAEADHRIANNLASLSGLIRLQRGTISKSGKPYTADQVCGLLDDISARIEATARGFILRPRDGRVVVLLAPPIDGDQASLVALLSDGAAWSTSALAMALGASQRTVQRALVELEAAGRVRSIGQARARRWLSPPLAGFTTILLLPAVFPLE